MFCYNLFPTLFIVLGVVIILICIAFDISEVITRKIRDKISPHYQTSTIVNVTALLVFIALGSIITLVYMYFFYLPYQF